MNVNLTQREWNFLMRMRQLEQGMYRLYLCKDGGSEFAFWVVEPLKIEGMIKYDHE